MNTEKFNKLLKKIKIDSNACSEIAKFYYAKIVFYIHRNYSGTNLEKDVAQEFFLRLFKMKIPDHIDFPATWIYKICDNIIKDFLADEKEYKLAFQKEESTSKNDLLDKIIFGETKEKLEKLDIQTSEIIKMNIWEGYSLKEIAIIKNLNYNTVRQIYSRGIKKLRKM